jgi:hypothetical protein
VDITLVDESFLTYWKALDFTTWNENDVREDFIAPLLSLLGYSKGTINDIKREPTLELSSKFHRIGRKKIQIDYIPTVRLKKFWIIEAKPGNTKSMDFGDYLQAHLYAIHPEVSVRFIVVTNGWEIRVYDSVLCNSWDDYILNVTQENCDSTFSEFKIFLSSQSIRQSLQNHVLSVISDSLKLEVDEEVAENFKRDVNQIYRDVIPLIRENARDLKLKYWQKRDAEEEEEIKKVSLEELLIYMDRPSDAIPFYSEEYVRRFIEADQELRNSMLGKLATIYRSRKHGIFNVQCINVMCRLLEENINAHCPNYANSVYDCLKELIEDNLNYKSSPFGNPTDHIGFALCHLDNICSRIAYKFCRRFGMKSLQEFIRIQIDTFSAEDLIINSPTVAREVVKLVGTINEILWSKFKGFNSPEIWDYIWTLQLIEDELDQIPQIEYSDGDADLLFFGNFGVSTDMYCFGTWNMLQIRSKGSKFILEKLPDNAQNLLKAKREDVIKNIPKPIPRPDNFTLKHHQVLEMIQSLLPNQ